MLHSPHDYLLKRDAARARFAPTRHRYPRSRHTDRNLRERTRLAEDPGKRDLSLYHGAVGHDPIVSRMPSFWAWRTEER